MELVKEPSPNGTPILSDIRPITNEERDAVRKQRGKAGRAVPAAPVKPGPHLELANMVTLNKLWPWVRKGLDRIKAKDKHSGTWTSQHVRHRVEMGLTGQAPVQMWFVKDTIRQIVEKDEIVNQPVGFFVATGYPDPYLACPHTLWIWLAAGKTFESRKYLKGSVKEIIEYGRNAGFANIQWGTGRMAWGKIARSLGFEAIQLIWEMKL